MKKRLFPLLLALVLLLSGCASPALTPVGTGQTAAPPAGTAPDTPAETAAQTPVETAPPVETGEAKKPFEGIPEGFCAGYGRVDITPLNSVPLAGFGSVEKRMSENVLDKLYATCIAFSDGENVALFFTLDLSTIPEQIQEGLRSTLAKKWKIPADYISFTATHTHSGPAITSKNDGAQNYYAKFIRDVIAAGDAALADLSEASLSWTTAKTERLNFVRRYLLADGSYSQNNSGNYPSPMVAHETDADPEMRVLYITRPGAKDIILVNWQAHPTLTGGEHKPDISADYVGAFRSKAEKELDVHFAFFQGAAGNLDPKSRLDGEGITTDYRVHGKALFETLQGALDKLTPVASGKIRVVHQVFTGTVNHEEETPERIAQAQEVSDALKISSDEARVVAEKYGFANYFSATSLLARLKMGKTLDMDFYAFAIGDLAVTTNPYEMFDTNGMELRAASPFACTMNFGYSNGHFGYIPSALGYEHRGYEGTTSRFVPGTGEEAVKTFTQMLEQLYAAA